MVLSPAGLYRRVVEVLSLDGPPSRLALALALGIFISCTPFYGFHTLMALAAAFILRLNKAVTVTGAWLNLPWFAPLVYGVSLKVGEYLLSGGQSQELGEIPWAEMVPSVWPPSSWPQLLDGLGQHSTLFSYVSRALLVGTTLVGLMAAVVAYVVALAAIREMRRPRHHAATSPDHTGSAAQRPRSRRVPR
jgi:uncharacterized protein (DUF2062 family)